MKKHISLILGAVAVLSSTPAISETNSGVRMASSADLSSTPATRERKNVNYQKYETRTTTSTYKTEDSGDLYYTQPVKRSELYKQYSSSNTNSGTTRTSVGRVNDNIRTTRAETVKSEMKRKYFLAHPFFQPTKGKFGSVTDIAFSTNKYNIEFNAEPFYISSDITVTVPFYDTNGDIMKNAKWKADQLLVKEDFSFGITDTFALMAMAQYNKSTYKLEWADSATPTDKNDDSGLNLFGIGGQYRFVDNTDWIGTISAYFQTQKDIANTFIAELKAGYKVNSTTVYGLARGWYLDLKGDSYGNGIDGYTNDGEYDMVFLAFKDNVSSATMLEAGIGVFSVLDEDWTFNLEATFGDYDWHNQASIKAAIGVQPTDWFALNLYAKTSIYDSADDKSVNYYTYFGDLDTGYEMYPLNRIQRTGSAKISDYNETQIGVQAIFMF